MKDITVIVPVFNIGETEEIFLKRALESAKDTSDGKSPVIIVGPEADVKKSEKIAGEANIDGLVYLTNTGKTDFCSQINMAVEKCNTKFFSILEMDDQYNVNWFRTFLKYKKEFPKVSVYLPLTRIEEYVSVSKDGEVLTSSVGFSNEFAWAASFVEEMGFIDEDALKNSMAVSPTGGIFRTKDFLSVGGLKPSIKLSFWYEFCLRMLHMKKSIYVVPLAGYAHTMNRPTSLMSLYRGGEISGSDEAEWWIDLAEKECMYKKDREIVYTGEEPEPVTTKGTTLTDYQPEETPEDK